MASRSLVEIWNRALGKIGHNAKLNESAEVQGGGPAGEECRRASGPALRAVLESYPWPHATRQVPLTQIDTQISDDAPGDGAQTVFTVTIPYRDPDVLTVQLVTIASGATTDLTTDDYDLTPADPDTAAPSFVTLDVAPSALQAVRFSAANSRTGWSHVYALPSDCVTPIALLGEGERFSLLPYDGRRDFRIMSNDAKNGQILCCDVDTDDYETLEYIAMYEDPLTMPALFEDAFVWKLGAELADPLTKDPKRAAYCAEMFRAALPKAFSVQINASHEPPPEPEIISVRR